MRRAATLLTLSLLVSACAKTETAQTDSMATAVAASDADFAGTWTGTVTPEGSDSVIVHFTQVCSAGSCTLTTQESKDTVMATYTISADSSVGMTAAFTDTTLATSPVVDHWVARVSNGQVSGHGMIVLADKPDSVVMRYRFTGSRVSQ